MPARDLSFSLPQSARRVIPRRVRRLPGIRSIEGLRYSEDKDVRWKEAKLESVFPDGLIGERERIEYERCHILAMSARVGSTALLTSLQLAGLSDFSIREIFNNRGYMESFVEKLGARTLCGYLNEYARLSGDGRLPFKIGWWDTAPLVRRFGADFDRWLPNATWVYLQRRDTVAQAYSLWKGAKHDVWHLREGEAYSSPVSGALPVRRIRQIRSLIEEENACWESFFRRRGIEPTRVYYEDFAEDSERVTRSAYLGFTGEPMQERFECPIVKSSDATDLENVEKLRLALAR